jgi:hypothetical protein
MNDLQITDHIEALVAEEHKLLSRESADSAQTDALETDRERLSQISIELDRCWDLLRQRRARRDAGQDPDDASERDATTVERYWQ